MLLYNYMSQLRQGCTHPGCQNAQANKYRNIQHLWVLGLYLALPPIIFLAPRIS